MLRAVIDGRQGVFLWRSMLDGVIIANEVVEEVKCCKNECLILKIDYEKTYDSIS